MNKNKKKKKKKHSNHKNKKKKKKEKKTNRRICTNPIAQTLRDIYFYFA